MANLRASIERLQIRAHHEEVIYVALAAAAAIVAMPLLAYQRMDLDTRCTVHGELILYKEANFNGETAMIDNARPPSTPIGISVRSRVFPGDRWQICARPRFRDPCIILTRNVPDATMIGIEGQIGSARLAPETPPATPRRGALRAEASLRGA